MPPEEDPEFQIAPMIDILLVLLVFFMSISSTEVLQVNKGVTLPVAKDAKNAEKNTKGQTIVNVLWNKINNAGSLEIGDDQIPAGRPDYAGADADGAGQSKHANPDPRGSRREV